MSGNPFTKEWMFFRWNGDQDGVFIGQYDENHKPDGLVRAVNKEGYVYEGNMTQDGERNGFGRLYHSNGSSYIGWWDNGCR